MSEWKAERTKRNTGWNATQNFIHLHVPDGVLAAIDRARGVGELKALDVEAVRDFMLEYCDAWQANRMAAPFIAKFGTPKEPTRAPAKNEDMLEECRSLLEDSKNLTLEKGIDGIEKISHKSAALGVQRTCEFLLGLSKERPIDREPAPPTPAQPEPALTPEQEARVREIVRESAAQWKEIVITQGESLKHQRDTLRTENAKQAEDLKEAVRVLVAVEFAVAETFSKDSIVCKTIKDFLARLTETN